MHRILIVLLAALALVACAGQPGPGAACDSCAVAETQPVGPGGAAAAAAATGGQRTSQDPRATDTARIQPFTPISRGAGDQTMNVTQGEGRTVASGAGVTQGLQVPTEALARAGAGAVPQAVQQIREDIAAMQADAKALLEDARTARAMGQVDAANDLMKEYRSVVDVIRSMQSSLAVAESGGATRITNYYFQQGQRVVQSVVSGTDAAPTPQSISERGGEAAAAALSTGAKAVMEADPEPASTAPLPAIPAEDLEAPPAGVSPVPTGTGG